MQVWKDAANGWQFKMLLLGEQHQGVFDTNIDRLIIQRLEALEINSKLSKKIVDDSDPDLCANIARPCLRLSLDQQNKVIGVLNVVWFLGTQHDVGSNIQQCLAFLDVEHVELSEHERQEINVFKSTYLTLDRVNVLYGDSPQNIAAFRATRATTTLADILKFVQLLALASARKLGHTGAVALPALPEGSEVVYGSRPRSRQNNALEWQALFVHDQPERDEFERILTDLRSSVENLSEEDTASVSQSLDLLRGAEYIWFASSKNISDLIWFRRVTDAVLRADHIQRLYTHPYQSLGMFGGRVESQALKNLRLNLRELRDQSWLRPDAIKKMSVQTILLWVKLGIMCFLLLIAAAVIANPLDFSDA